ncbi:unnamed protein product, partial [Brassica rapa subsp. trilocularis]
RKGNPWEKRHNKSSSSSLLLPLSRSLIRFHQAVFFFFFFLSQFHQLMNSDIVSLILFKAYPSTKGS